MSKSTYCYPCLHPMCLSSPSLLPCHCPCPYHIHLSPPPSHCYSTLSPPLLYTALPPQCPCSMIYHISPWHWPTSACHSLPVTVTSCTSTPPQMHSLPALYTASDILSHHANEMLRYPNQQSSIVLDQLAPPPMPEHYQPSTSAQPVQSFPEQMHRTRPHQRSVSIQVSEAKLRRSGHCRQASTASSPAPPRSARSSAITPITSFGQAQTTADLIASKRIPGLKWIEVQ